MKLPGINPLTNALKTILRTSIRSSGWTSFLYFALFCFIMLSTCPTSVFSVESLLKLDKKWTGDFDEMVKIKKIRALVPYSKTHYFLDGAHQRGLAYEMLKELEKYINKQLKTKTLRVRVIIIPTKRDRLLPGVAEGLGDMAVANLTITPERQKLVDFSNPSITGVTEIVVTGPTAPKINTVEDLSGKEIYVRKSSSYYQSLKALNDRFKKSGKPPVKITTIDAYLEDEDILEMINASLLPMTIIDSHKVALWVQVFENITAHKSIKIRSGGNIGMAIRKKSPKFKKILDAFVEKNKKGTLLGNIMFKRYLQNTQWVRNAYSKEDMERFDQTVALFQKYSDQYGFDWLMVAALAYQESRIDQSKRSQVGAIGVMQLLPSTAKDPNVNIPQIEELESNIHAGTKYLRFLKDRYFKNEPMDELDKVLFTFAGYNAGPAKVARLRKEAKEKGLDPNVWFRSVEIIAAKRIGRETVQYVGNIYKYYTAYKLIVRKLIKKEQLIKEKIEEKKSSKKAG